MSSESAPKIVVLGSINMDLVVQCQSLPLPGQTIAAKSSHQVCGGKGANQAVAAAKLGANVEMIGRVGDDAFSQRLLTNLRDHSVQCENVQVMPDCASGLAIVGVEESGENSIVLVAGANGEVSISDAKDCSNLIESADVLLLQLEVPTESVLAAIKIAKVAGVRCIVDPAPVAKKWSDKLLQVDLVCPNETEAAAITGLAVTNIHEAEVAAKQLHQRGAKYVAITLGKDGVVLVMDDQTHHITSPTVTAVDTTAAGDAFAGALGVRWAETDDLLEAVRFASVAGANAATRMGAQPSLPSRAELEAKRTEL